MSNVQEAQGTVEKTLPGKPFYKRTEWWGLIAALIVGGLLGSGVLGIDAVASKIAAMIVECLAACGYAIARTIAKSAVGTGKPGWKTTEFWSSLGSGGLVAVQGTGLLQTGGQGEAILTALLSIMPTVVYAVGRGKVKAATSIPILLALVLPVIGCATWEKESRVTLAELHAGLKVITAGGQKLIGETCTEKARACRDERRAAEAKGDAAGVAAALACQPLVACHASLKRFDTVMIGGQLGVADGLAAVNLGQAVAAKDLQAIITRVRELIAEGQRTIAELGGRQ